MAERNTSNRRRARALVAAAVFLSLVLSMFGAASALPDAGAERAQRVVEQLVRLAALEAEAGAQPRTKLPVRVNQEGGPLWVSAAVEAAVREQPSLMLADDGVGIVRMEVISDPTHLALRGSLYRQGWNLRSEHPLQVRVAPWGPMFALALGCAAMAFSRRMGVGFAVAGVAAQVIDAALDWPADFLAIPWQAQVRDGPVGSFVIELALGLPDAAVAVGAGVVTLCTMLVAFDHRRSSGRGGAMMAAGLLGVLGLLLWTEAAARCGMGPWIGTAAGAASILAMALAWGQQGATLRRA